MGGLSHPYSARRKGKTDSGWKLSLLRCSKLRPSHATVVCVVLLRMWAGDDMSDEREKTCFIISPIGEPESTIRKDMDKWLKYIVVPCLDERGFKHQRGDQTGRPMLIQSDVADHIINDALAIANLTEVNPNVMYELGLRHAFQLPTILMHVKTQELPFDVSPQRSIPYSSDVEDVEAARAELTLQLDEILSDGYEPENPFTRAVERSALLGSDDDMNERYGEILESLSQLQAGMASLTSDIAGVTRDSEPGSSWRVVGGTTPPPSIFGTTERPAIAEIEKAIDRCSEGR